MSHRSKIISSLATLALVGAGVGAVTAGQASAESAAKPKAHTLASDLLSPLSLAVSEGGTIYFSQNFAGLLMRQEPGQKKPEVIYGNKEGFEVGAVSEHDGHLRFALSKFQRRGVIMAIGKRGKPWPLANIGTFEKRRNPDAQNTYGFRNISDECAAQIPEEEFGPATYRGIVETHPFATTQSGGTTYVADAAANAIFAIPRPGKVRTVAVLPPTLVKIDAAAAEHLGFPTCVAGKRYAFEPVPTDVERGPDGFLYVTSLPGGPEDPSLGANGRVYRVNPRTGKVVKVVDGLASATGLAVAGNGDIFVAELFGGRISRTRAGASSPHTFLKAPLPADVELTGRGMYATTNALPGEGAPPAGMVVRVSR